MRNFFIFIIIFLKFSLVNADTNIAYLDMQHILKKSLVGISFEKYLSSFQEDEIKNLKILESEILKKEKELISQKNIIKKEEYEKKFLNLQNQVNQFRINKNKLDNEKKNKRLEYTKKIVNSLNPIISKYVEDNSLSIVFPKKTVLIGKKSLDITDDITNLLDKKIKDLKDLNYDN